MDPIPVFLLTFACGLVLNIVAFFLLGGRALLAEGRGDDAETEAVGTPELWTARQILTIVLFAGILGLGLLAGIDVGFLALSAAGVLALVFPSDLKEGMERIGRAVVLLIGGIVAYITVLQNAGVVDSLAGSVSGIGVPLAAGLLMLYVAGAVSAFASTNAMFGALVPLAAPLLTGGDLPVLGFVVALSVAASSSDASPFSTGGALVVTNTEEAKRTRTFKGLMAWGMSMVAVTPVLV
ncbi:hypothetical protein GCM10009755_25050 [Brevibacterium samyangense]|uniref:Citrate transporter-like domain-containing protein n=1 Tax=Brevibacterium samyangense TaxID=366888 RepID=A0ABP5F3B6_9MICO